MRTFLLSAVTAVTAATAVLLAGCGGGDHEFKNHQTIILASSVFVHDGDVYVAGYRTFINADGLPTNRNQAMLWKNGVAQTLGNVQHWAGPFEYQTSEAISVSVSDSGNVYVVGTAHDFTSGYTSIVLWVNGSPNSVDRSPHPIYIPKSIAISGEDVYIGADDWSGGKGPRAMFWKNGTPTRLVNQRSYLQSMFVSGEDVYAIVHTLYKGMILKNGIEQTSDIPVPWSIYVSGEDVYVAAAGGTYPDATGMNRMPSSAGGVIELWKNNEKQPALTNEAGWLNATAHVFVSGEDVYVLGKENNKIVCWKNGEKGAPLVDNIYSGAESIFVSGDDVYVTATVEGRGKLWRNGVEQTLQGKSPSQ
jgi:hypothetical protein